MASPDKIDNRRGQRKCFSDTELERWAEAHRPVSLVAEPVERLGVIEPQYHEPQEIRTNRSTPAPQRAANLLRVVREAGLPLDDHARLPRKPHDVEEHSLHWGEPHSEESTDHAA